MRLLSKLTERERTVLARKGAKALHSQDKAHKFSSEQAKEAARKRWDKRKLDGLRSN